MCNVRTHVTHENTMSRVRTYVKYKKYNVRTFVIHEYEMCSVRTYVSYETNLVVYVLDYPMLYTKVQGHRTLGSEEGEF